ncbi:hypothetical protein GEMRC1_013733 [Eukaryota sp. GEM-RC1]
MLILLLVVVVSVSSAPLPGLEYLAVNLDDPGNGKLNVDASANHLRLKVNAKIAGQVVSLHDAVAFEESLPDPRPTFYVKNSRVFRKICPSNICSVQQVSPLEAFSHLSFVYHNSNPAWNFDYDWNYDHSTGGGLEEYNFGPVTFKDAYVKASSGIHLEYDFNLLQGLKKAEARFTQQLNSSVGILTEPFDAHISRHLASAQLAEFTLSVMGIPIPIKIHLNVTAFAAVKSTIVVDASILLTTQNAEMTTGWNSYNGFFFNSSFGDMKTVFKKEFTGQLNVIAGIDAKISVNIANSLDFYGIITPFLNATVRRDVCLKELHYKVDFGLNLLLGMTDIVIDAKVREFTIEVGRDFLTHELVRHNIINACSSNVTMAEVAAEIPDTAPQQFLVQAAISSSSEVIANSYVWRPATRAKTKLCTLVGTTCTIHDYTFVNAGIQERFEFYRQRRFWFDVHLATYILTFDSDDNKIRHHDNRRFDFSVTQTQAIQPNTYVNTQLSGQFRQYFAIDAPQDSHWSSRTFLWGGIHADMETFASNSVLSEDSETLLPSSRGRSIPVPSSRKRTITWNCPTSHKLVVKVSNEDTWEIEVANGHDSVFRRWPVTSKTIIFEEHRTFPLSNVEVARMTINERSISTTSRSWHTSRSSCAVDVTIDEPDVFIRLQNPDGWSGTYPFVFILSDTLTTWGCAPVMANGFYHFDTFSEPTFFHVTGKFYDLIQEDKVSERGLIVKRWAVIVSVEVQDVCVTRYEFRSIGDSYSTEHRVAFLVTAPRLATTRLQLPSNIRASSTRLHGDFWYSDMTYNEPTTASELVISNTGQTNFEVVVIFECTSSSCSGTIPTPQHDVILKSGQEYLIGSTFATSYVLASTCAHCLVEYDLFSSTSVTLQHTGSGDSSTLTQGSGTISVADCAFKTLQFSGEEGDLIFTSTCFFDSNENVYVAEMSKSIVETGALSLQNDPNKGFVLFDDLCDYCYLSGSMYTGEYSVLFLQNVHDYGSFSLESFGPSFVNHLTFTPLSTSIITCEAVDYSRIECDLAQPNVFDSQLDDPDFFSLYVQIESTNSNEIETIELITPRQVVFGLSQDLSSSNTTLFFSKECVISEEEIKVAIARYDPKPTSSDSSVWITVVVVVIASIGLVIVGYIVAKKLKAKKSVNTESPMSLQSTRVYPTLPAVPGTENTV